MDVHPDGGAGARGIGFEASGARVSSSYRLRLRSGLVSERNLA
jgi:hypothetical protein